MKTLPAGLSAMLATGVTTLATCWRIERLDGLVFGFTDHDQVLSFSGVDYLPDTGFTRSEAEASLGLAVDTAEVEGALSSDIITLDDLALGLWDGARAEIWTVDWSDTTNRVIRRKGTLGELVRGDLYFSTEIRALSQQLQQQQGRTYQRICDAVLGDARCTIDLNDPARKGSGIVLSSSDRRILVVAGLDLVAAAFFALGLLTWTSGANAGAAIEVRHHAFAADGTVTLTLWQRTALPIVADDEFTVTQGCDKTFATCLTTFDNVANFRGFPHMPGNDFALSTVKRDQENDGGSFFNGS